jgi:hypothetical protein
MHTIPTPVPAAADERHCSPDWLEVAVVLLAPRACAAEQGECDFPFMVAGIASNHGLDAHWPTSVQRAAD